MELYVIALPFGDRCRHQPDHPTYPDHSRNTAVTSEAMNSYGAWGIMMERGISGVIPLLDNDAGFGLLNEIDAI